MTPTVGALFAGYAGLELGIAQVIPGVRTAWVADIEPGPCAILAHRFPDAPNLGDVTAVDWASVPPVDIIAGGSPCQDLSLAGARAGMGHGTRSGLWASMVDAIETIKPRLVVWENVRGALSARADSAGEMESCAGCVGDDDTPSLRALGRLLGDLADVGYDAAWCGVRASDVGAPHQRFRVFLIAWPAGGLVPAALPSRERREGLDAGSGAALAGLAADRGSARRPDPPVDPQAKVYLPTPTASGSGNTPEQHLAKKPGRTRVTELNIITDHGLMPADFGIYSEAVRRWEALTRPAPPPTEPTGRDGAHRLSPAFVEWMMGLPAGWVTDPAIGLTRNHQLRALGNGVVPQQAAAAITHLLRIREAAAC